MPEINIPDEVGFIIETFEKSGYEAYAVGGCVRDSLLGIEPKDWDVCTPALPEQTMEVFAGQHIIETGLKHGTVTLMLNHKPFEITTYRVDGKYTDNRRPDSVKFVDVLKRDLSRRDFTINAMAYSPKTGVIDYYNGREDIAAGVIKCVGNPDKRFKEDALRIMRALRFAAALCFGIDDRTAESIRANKHLLCNIAAERISAELNILLLCDGVKDILLKYADILSVVIPDIEPMFGFEQNTPYHHLDVWTHTVESIVNAPADLVLRLTMFFHDIGKPHSYTEADGVGHFYKHHQVSAEIAKTTLRELKYDNKTIDAVEQLVYYHDRQVEPELRSVRRLLSKIGEPGLRQLLLVKRADTLAQPESLHEERLTALDKIAELADEIIDKQQCFTLKDLAVNGKDLIDIGITEGTDIGKKLAALLEEVIEGRLENDKAGLLSFLNIKH